MSWSNWFCGQYTYCKCKDVNECRQYSYLHKSLMNKMWCISSRALLLQIDFFYGKREQICLVFNWWTSIIMFFFGLSISQVWSCDSSGILTTKRTLAILCFLHLWLSSAFVNFIHNYWCGRYQEVIFVLRLIIWELSMVDSQNWICFVLNVWEWSLMKSSLLAFCK